MFSNILCAVDLNLKYKVTITKAVQIAHQFNSKIFFLHVLEDFMNKEEMKMLRVNVDTVKSEFEKTAIMAKNEMKGIIHKLHAEDIDVEFILKEGKPNKIICEEAKKNKSDLIVVGKATSNSFTSIILSRNINYVIKHAQIPVLTVPATE